MSKLNGHNREKVEKIVRNDETCKGRSGSVPRGSPREFQRNSLVSLLYIKFENVEAEFKCIQ